MRFLPFDRVAIFCDLRKRGLITGTVETEAEPLEDFIGRHFAHGERELLDAASPTLLTREVVAVRADAGPAIIWPIPAEQLKLIPADSVHCN